MQRNLSGLGKGTRKCIWAVNVTWQVNRRGRQMAAATMVYGKRSTEQDKPRGGDRKSSTRSILAGGAEAGTPAGGRDGRAIEHPPSAHEPLRSTPRAQKAKLFLRQSVLANPKLTL